MTPAGVVISGSECTGNITIHSSATSIGDSAFASASGLLSVTIQSGVTSIGEAAFYLASSLNTITIPSTVQSIGGSAFRSTAITTLTIPSSVNLIGDFAFYSMTNLTSITVDPANTNFSSLGGVLFNKLQSQLIQYPSRKTGTSYEVPSSVTSISAYSFGSIASLTSITIPNSVTSFASNIFPFMSSPITSYTYCGSASLSGTGISGTRTSCSTTSGAPTIGTATATGTTTATVSFTAPTSDGGSTILSYTATSSPGSITATITQAGSGTISVTGLSPATSYTFTISAVNSVGASSASAASNTIKTSSAAAETTAVVSGPPPSFLKVKNPSTISLIADIYTCTAGTLIFWRYSVTEEPSKLAYQKISLLRDGVAVTSEETLKSKATFEKNSSWTGSTMTCQIYAAQENSVGTFSSFGADRYNELSKMKSASIKAANSKYSTDRTSAYDIRRAELLRISNEKASELKIAKTSAQIKAASVKYRLAMTRISDNWKAEIKAAPARRDSAIALAQATFIQELAKYGLSIIQP